ncbi:MAG TPA: family 43 glycosylhydrolase, partial [Candidatus Caenarcaniphilales bacterium]
WWTVSKICSAISTDLRQWQDLGTILEADPGNPWESGRILAGCTYKEKGLYYLFYPASGQGLDLKNEAISLATSSDGCHWQRSSHHPLVQPPDNNLWYGRCNWTGHFHWRDPYLFKDPNTGRYYMFTCASSKTPGNFQGCVGLAVADQITGPYQLLPPVLAATSDTAADWPYYHTERPQVIFKDGKYHLFFSCFRMFLNPRWLQKVNSQRITTSSLYWYISDTITGPFQPACADESIVAGSEKTGMYGTNLLKVSTDPEKFMPYGWYHRLHALAVSPTFRATWPSTERLTINLDPKS